MTTPAEHLAWTKGGHAQIVKIEGDLVVLRSTSPVPPGARVEAKLGAEGALATGALVKVKSHGSKREGDGSFTMKGRLLDATRELRDALTALARGLTPSQGL